MRSLYRCGGCAEAGIALSMVRFGFLLICLIGFLVPGAVFSQTPDSAINTSRGMQRRYPGGRDETDLTVQQLRKIQKPDSGEPGHFEPENPEYDATASDVGFGE